MDEWVVVRFPNLLFQSPNSIHRRGQICKQLAIGRVYTERGRERRVITTLPLSASTSPKLSDIYKGGFKKLFCFGPES